jgi:DNA repair photolyase
MAKMGTASAGNLWHESKAPPLRLVGIARLAEMGEAVDSGHDVEFRSIPTRSLLNRTNSKRFLPFAWSINPYRGCEFACRYCYARYAHAYMEKDPHEFERKIYIKEYAAWLLAQELKQVKPGEGIAIGTATDPYQPVERRQHLTRSILEVLSRSSGHHIGLVTKSNLIVRDIDLFQKIAERNTLRLHLTVTTTDHQLARKLEPRAPRPDLRLEAVRRLRAAGLETGVLCCPVLPRINDSTQNLDSVVRAAKAVDACFVSANAVYFSASSLAVFMPFLHEKFPEHVRYYEENFSVESPYVSKAYADQIRTKFHTLTRRHGLLKREEMDSWVNLKIEPQLSLFG